MWRQYGIRRIAAVLAHTLAGVKLSIAVAQNDDRSKGRTSPRAPAPRGSEHSSIHAEHNADRGIA